MLIDLTQMRPGETGVIVELQGGRGVMSRIQNMGIRFARIKDIIKYKKRVDNSK